LKNGHRIVLWTLFTTWLILLVYLSSEDGLSTAHTSGKLTAFVVRLFHIRSELTWRIDHTLRTSAHFVGFFILGGLAHAAAAATWVGLRRPKIRVILSCILLSIIDEVKKVFIPGRHLSWEEAGINVLGIMCGVLVSMLVAKMSVKSATLRSRPDG
jgi:VanZ family protein